jgi:hypothetical protein
MYTINSSERDETYNIKIVETNSFIPLDPANSDYQAVLDALIEQNADYFEGDIPEDLQTAADAKLFNTQADEYRTATARLEQYQLSVGRPEVTESQPTGEQVFNEETMEMEDVLEEVIVQTAIEPLEPTVEITVYDEEDLEAEPTTETVPNPLIVADDAERAEAQTVIDNTPESVKEHVDNE